jgi:hypothetical protein
MASYLVLVPAQRHVAWCGRIRSARLLVSPGSLEPGSGAGGALRANAGTRELALLFFVVP